MPLVGADGSLYRPAMRSMRACYRGIARPCNFRRLQSNLEHVCGEGQGSVSAEGVDHEG